MRKKKIFLTIFCIFMIISCSSTETTKTTTHVQNEEVIVTQKMDELKIEQDRILASGTMEEIDRVILENALLKSFNNWKGTRYAWGGDSLKGIDCSALTRRVYREVFNYELPRVSVDQVKVGRKISTSELKPGDILFFRPEGRVNHTAVYLGNSLFINASSSKGVIISSLESNYWGKYFKYAVRVDQARMS